MTVLREVSSGPLPALATSVELCDSEIYTKAMRSELQWRVEKVLVEFQRLVGDIPLDGKVLSNERKNGTMAGMGKGSLATTGVVWGACDDVVELKMLGIAGLMIKKVEQYRDTVKDALEELQEWGEETSDDEEEDDDLHEGAMYGNGSCNPAQDAVDDIFQDQRHIPANDVNKVRERLECTFRRLKLINLLHQAIIKRRLKTLPTLSHASASSTIISRLDAVIPQLSRIPDSVDDLASAFYSLDNDGINAQMRECFSNASAAADLLVTNWEGNKDEFSAWNEKFQAVMAEGW
jgi:Grap2 and cyclin-D-interacting